MRATAAHRDIVALGAAATAERCGVPTTAADRAGARQADASASAGRTDPATNARLSHGSTSGRPSRAGRRTPSRGRSRRVAHREPAQPAAEDVREQLGRSETRVRGHADEDDGHRRSWRAATAVGARRGSSTGIAIASQISTRPKTSDRPWPVGRRRTISLTRTGAEQHAEGCSDSARSASFAYWTWTGGQGRASARPPGSSPAWRTCRQRAPPGSPARGRR